MSDLESRLTEALRAGADDAPDVAGLAAGARQRLRTRRLRRTGVVGAVAVLAVAVPTAVVASRGSDTSGPPIASSPSTSPDPVSAADPGYRWESWHGVSAQVPHTWGYGTLTSWCATAGRPAPRVQRPEDVGEDIACTPTETYGLTFSVAPKPGLDWPVAPQDNDSYPAEAYVGTRDVAGVFIEVGTSSFALSQRILDSVTLTADVRPDGCPAAPSQQPAPLVDDEVAVCGYDEAGMLSRSELLTGADAARVSAALQAGVPDGFYDGCKLLGPAAATVRVATKDTWRGVDPRLGHCLLDGGQ